MRRPRPLHRQSHLRAAAYETAVIGGGLVGAAVAWGLARLGERVALLDEGDCAHRAARGNFGLVWVQGKGLGMPPYAAWTVASARDWPTLAVALRDATGLDVALDQPGGFHLALSDAELATRMARLDRLHDQPGMPSYPVERCDRAALVRHLPGLGPEVAGGSYCPLDGHCNSLRLFRALHAALAAEGARYLPDHLATRIDDRAGEFIITTRHGPVAAGKVVLAAGLGNARLAPMVGLAAPVRPQRGQIVVTERVPRFLAYPVSTLRQTDEGSVLVGDSAEEAGVDDRVGLGITATEAARAVRMFPHLTTARVVRCWAALRVMSPDGFPIYDASTAYPGAFLVTCHSGVTLAARHVFTLAPMLHAGRLAPDLAPFSARRFDVPATAAELG
jgi:hydrogen cyanide synthase HcnC